MIRTAVIAATAALAHRRAGLRRNRGELPPEPPAPVGRHRRGRDAQGQRVAHRVGGHGPAGRRPLAGPGAPPAAGSTMTTYLAHHAGELAERLRARARHPGRRGDREEPAQLRRPQPGDRAAATGSAGTASSARTQNSTYWGVIALRAAGVPAPRRLAGRHPRPPSARTAAMRGRHRPGRTPTTPRRPSWRCGPPASRAAAAPSRGPTATWQRPRPRRTATRSCPGARRTASRRHGRSRPATAASLSNRQALAWLHARQLPSGAYNYQPGVTTTPALVTGAGAPGRERQGVPDRIGRPVTGARRRRSRSGRSRAAGGPRASWSRRRGRPAWRRAAAAARAASWSGSKTSDSSSPSRIDEKTAIPLAPSAIWMPDPKAIPIAKSTRFR